MVSGCLEVFCALWCLSRDVLVDYPVQRARPAFPESRCWPSSTSSGGSSGSEPQEDNQVVQRLSWDVVGQSATGRMTHPIARAASSLLYAVAPSPRLTLVYVGRSRRTVPTKHVTRLPRRSLEGWLTIASGWWLRIGKSQLFSCSPCRTGRSDVMAALAPISGMTRSTVHRHKRGVAATVTTQTRQHD